MKESTQFQLGCVRRTFITKSLIIMLIFFNLLGDWTFYCNGFLYKILETTHLGGPGSETFPHMCLQRSSNFSHF